MGFAPITMAMSDVSNGSDTSTLPPVAYLTSLYPAVSHTFIQREVLELRRVGATVETFTIRPAPEEHLLSSDDRAEAERTESVLPVPLGRLISTHLRALRRPLAYLRTLGRALSLSPGGVRGRRWQAFCFAEAMVLHQMLERRGIRHIHVHFANASADVAMLVTEYADRPRERWSWSFTMHGSTEFYDVEQRRLRQKIESACAVACISDFTRSQMMRSVGSEHWPKLGVVHCGIDPSVYRAPSTEREPGTLSVLFVGRLVEAKGIDLLVDAVAHAVSKGRDVNLTVVGDGPHRNALEDRAHAQGIAARARFVGAVGQDRIRPYFEKAAALCLPSFAEGVPIVLMEAMAMRRPVITTQIMGVPELVEDGRSGLLVAPGRADELATAIMRLADDPSFGQRMGEEGRAKVLAEFDIKDSGPVLQEFLSPRIPRRF